MTNHETTPEPDIDLAVANDLPVPDVEAPRGMEWDDSSDTLLNTIEADELILKPGIEGLLWLGYMTEDFTMMGHAFSIRTLTRGERLACTLVAKEWEETLGFAAAYETATVGAALMFIDDEPFQPHLQRSDSQNRIRENFSVVQNYYEPLVAALGRKVAILHMRQQQAFDELESKS